MRGEHGYRLCELPHPQGEASRAPSHSRSAWSGRGFHCGGVYRGRGGRSALPLPRGDRAYTRIRGNTHPLSNLQIARREADGDAKGILRCGAGNEWGAGV